MLKNLRHLSIPEIEEKILKFWRENKIFEKSVSYKLKAKSFSFYDGPPFLSGKPHYGHILATVIKDAVTRFWTMRGFRVERKVGWDCHGLPVENLIEQNLGLKSKKDIEKIGIDKFNAACRNYVLSCERDFRETLQRVGRWADYTNAYFTLDNSYMESVWWVLRQLWDAGLVYKDFRVTPYCPRCGTPLSNFEVAQGYREIEDPSIYVKFPVKGEKNTFFLVWTTTPWTLPANLVLAINRKISYVKVKIDEDYLILAKDRLNVIEGNYKIVAEVAGRDIQELLPFYRNSTGQIFYEQIFDFYQPTPELFFICYSNFVSTEEGTGIVHIAPAYGEEDMELAKKLGFSDCAIHCVDKEGKFTSDIRPWAGLFVKDADPEIIENLKERNLLYKTERIKHNYPFCWRCDSPLLYMALSTWYIAVTKIKQKLIKNNKKIHWVPEHIKEGRFGKWLAEARDWAFSRNRFWGAPLPIWQCNSCKNYFAIGSLKELKKLSIDNKYPQSKDKKVDLHRPYIDEVKLKCPKCGGESQRVSQVFDCWFESGSMPYAQWHYPYENKNLVEKTFPADFIAEGLDQTRGWFYTLHVLAAALTLKDIGLGKDRPAFKNVVVNGLILDEYGRKLSKKLRNYPEPAEVFKKYGADALRYFLLSSTQMGEDYQFSPKGVEEIFRKVIDKFRNVFNFYQLYANNQFQEVRPLRGSTSQILSQIRKEVEPHKVNSLNILDRWIITRLHEVVDKMTKRMEAYELTETTRILMDFIDDLSNWYLRRSRRRFQRIENEIDYQQASLTLFVVLLETSKLMAPFAPFISEAVYKSLEVKLNSVHLENWPKANKKLIDKDLLKRMVEVRRLASLALAKRMEMGIKVRQPLASLKVKRQASGVRSNKELLDILKDEVNVKKIIFDSKIKDEIELDTEITAELKMEGVLRELTRSVQGLRQDAGYQPKDKIILMIKGPEGLKKILEKNLNFLKKEINARNIELKPPSKFDAELKTKINDWPVWLGIRKI